MRTAAIPTGESTHCDRDLDHAVTGRMASLSGVTGYSVRANGRIRGRWAVKHAGRVDGGVVLCSQRGFAARLQPLPDTAADRVPAYLPMAGACAPGNQLHRLTDGIHRDVLVRDRSRPSKYLSRTEYEQPAGKTGNAEEKADDCCAISNKTTLSTLLSSLLPALTEFSAHSAKEPEYLKHRLSVALAVGEKVRPQLRDLLGGVSGS